MYQHGNWLVRYLIISQWWLSSLPCIGTAATIVAIIAGQIIMGLMVDHFGWFGNTQIVLDYKRIAAIALLAGALYLIYLSNKRQVED